MQLFVTAPHLRGLRALATRHLFYGCINGAKSLSIRHLCLTKSTPCSDGGLRDARASGKIARLCLSAPLLKAQAQIRRLPSERRDDQCCAWFVIYQTMLPGSVAWLGLLSLLPTCLFLKLPAMMPHECCFSESLVTFPDLPLNNTGKQRGNRNVLNAPVWHEVLLACAITCFF